MIYYCGILDKEDLKKQIKENNDLNDFFTEDEENIFDQLTEKLDPYTYFKLKRILDEIDETKYNMLIQILNSTKPKLPTTNATTTNEEILEQILTYVTDEDTNSQIVKVLNDNFGKNVETWMSTKLSVEDPTKQNRDLIKKHLYDLCEKNNSVYYSAYKKKDSEIILKFVCYVEAGILSQISKLYNDSRIPFSIKIHVLQIAAENGYMEVFKYLLTNTEKYYNNHKTAIFRRLINLGTNKSDKNAINRQFVPGLDDALCNAAKNGHNDIVALLITAIKKYNKHPSFSLALYYAKLNNHTEIVELLSSAPRGGAKRMSKKIHRHKKSSRRIKPKKHVTKRHKKTRRARK